MGDVKRLRWRWLILLSGVPLLAACGIPLGDPYTRPVGIGRTPEGQFRFVVPLCGGESVSAFEVEGHQTERPVWKVSQPIRSEEQQGVIVLGEAGGFARQEVPLQLPLPANISVSVELSSRSAVGQGFLLNEVPEALARNDNVLGFDGEAVPEEEFRDRVSGEYC